MLRKCRKYNNREIICHRRFAMHTDSECNKCGAHLEWKAEFNDISSPRYIALHCGLDYLITIDTVKVKMVKVHHRTKNKRI